MPHKLLLGALMLLLCAAANGQDRLLLGSFQSPKGFGASIFFVSRDGTETDILTLRTDFYGLLAGRTRDVGGCLAYTHDYLLFATDGPDFRIQLHAGAGGALAYVHDFENGFFSATERLLERNPGIAAGLAGNLGLRVDFRRHLTLDVSFSAIPGVHLRTDHHTGTLLVSLYRNGLYHAYYPQLNLMYRF